MRRGRLDALVSPGIIFLILLCGAAGLDRPVAGRTIPVLCALAGLVWIGRIFIFKKDRCRAGAFFLGTGLLFLLLSLYYVNPSYHWKEHLGALPVSHIRFLPASAFPAALPNTMIFYGLVLAAGGLAMHLGTRSTCGLVLTVLAGAAITAMVVLDQRLTPRPYPVYELTGFFSYENHYAAFANLTLPVALAYAERLRFRAFEAGRVSSPAVLLYAVAALSAGAVMVSRSRAGMAVTGVLCILFLLRRLQFRRSAAFASPPSSTLIRAATGLAGLALIAGVFTSGPFHARDLSRIGEELSFRSQVVTDTLALWRHDVWWGSGPRSFVAVFPYYQTHPSDQFFFTHAHCEPVEFLAEYGILGTTILLAALVLIFLSRTVTRADPCTPSFRELEGSGFALALGGIALHSLVDFPLRHPLNALLTSVWLGILIGRVNGVSTLMRYVCRNKSKYPDGEAE